MVKFLFSAVFFVTLVAWSQKKEHLISHKEEIIVTDPSKGSNSYKRWAQFPSKKQDIRQVMLHLTFECPDKMRCADWDYVDHIIARQKNDSTTYEIARMLTPYGGRFQKDWKFEWKVDVTDFSAILRDSVEVDYIHSGYEDNKTRGWKVTVDFEIIYGKPVAEPVAIHKIYEGSYKYGYGDDPIEDHLKAITIKADSRTKFSKIKVHQTGHGMDASGCGEFCDKYRDILFNGKVVNTKNLWMECGDNPLYPQAGTWIFDRANWCPGYLLQPDEVLLPTKAGKAYTVAINMEPYETEKPSANEVIWAYVMEYGKANSANDVTLVDILAPSTEDIYNRKNPTGGLPVIRIKNNGRDVLKTLVIKYYLEGETPKEYTWTGNIPFGDTAILTLPEEVYSDKESARFYVELKEPNGKKDGYQEDNIKRSTYLRPSILPKEVVVYFKTNNKPHQNTYGIKDSYGKVIFARDSLELEPATVYQDTLQLAEGNYSFTVDDNQGDGLEFWFKAKAGRGDVMLLDSLGRAIKHFDPDFGSGIVYNFAVKNNVPYELDNTPFVSIFPARTDGPVTMEYFANNPADVKVVIAQQENEDKIVKEFVYPNFKKGTILYNLSDLPKMRYYFKVYVGGKQIFKNRIRLKE